ncbi:bifunctional phosphoglucose/phosphomannose isomerase [Candidatus Woesearchaeota archaeon]|nr:bifunctional phosphoglucose/phosphomannose isomerase [Candidatus Woesearchaeota archaeon]
MTGYDRSNMLKILGDFPKQCRKAVKSTYGFKLKKKRYSNICVCGMGGSGIGGELLKPLVQYKNIKIIPHHDYGLPKEADKNSLVIVVSYSGNTEETLSAHSDARKKKANIIAITSGGLLGEREKDAVTVPKGLQPREAIGYLFLTMVAILSKNKIIPNQSSAINEAIRILHPKETKKKAFMLAKKMEKKIPVFYAPGELEAVAYRMKTQINENAKQPAFHHVFPEMNHNEINGFKKQGKRLVTVFIQDKKGLNDIKKRMKVTKNLIKENTNVVSINVRGKSLLAKMLTTIYLGDLASYYLALMNKVDPTPVPVVEELKKKL